jgi:hypothetical protein
MAGPTREAPYEQFQWQEINGENKPLAKQGAEQ